MVIWSAERGPVVWACRQGWDPEEDSGEGSMGERGGDLILDTVSASRDVIPELCSNALTFERLSIFEFCKREKLSRGNDVLLGSARRSGGTFKNEKGLV